MKSKLRWKASLLERRERQATTLSEEDVEFLVINTRFSVDDIREWYRQFILECPQVFLITITKKNLQYFFRVGLRKTKLNKCWRGFFLVKLLIPFRI